MLGNTQNYKQTNLKFSPSKLYFQHQNEILQKLWFISPIIIDIHFKYTFQEIGNNYFIEGGEFEWLTADHDINEQWIIYKIWFFNPKFKNIFQLSLDLKKNLLDNPSFLPLLWWFLWWGAIFGLLSRLYNKWGLWNILFWLNTIWGGILLLVLIRKISKFWYNKLKTKRVNYWWFSANYDNQTDALMLSPEVVKILKNLKKDFWIVKFCYTWNCIYLLQDIHDHEWNRLSWSSKLYSEQEKAKLQQKTLSYLHLPEFLSVFSLD